MSLQHAATSLYPRSVLSGLPAMLLGAVKPSQSKCLASDYRTQAQRLTFCTLWHQTINMDRDGTLSHNAKSCAALNAVEKAVYSDCETETFRPQSGQMRLAKPSLKAL